MDRFLKKSSNLSGAAQASNASQDRQRASKPKQKRLSQCKKVVKLKASKYCICPEELRSLKRTIESSESSSQELLHALRYLDCLQLHIQDLQASQIGKAVKKLRRHQDVDVQVLARGVVEKWRNVVLSEAR